jgi:hypothetical protein
MLEAMNMDFSVGDKEIDEKIQEWLQWDKVFCISQICLLGKANGASQFVKSFTTDLHY